MSVNDSLIHGSTLCFRTWRAPPLMQLDVNGHGPFAVRTDPRVGLLPANLSWLLKEAKLIGPSAKAPGLSGERANNSFQLHPVVDGLAIARMLRGVSYGFREIVVDIALAHAEASPTEFLLGVVSSECTEEELVKSLDITLLASSGWKAIAANESTQIVVILDTPNGLAGDIILATRIVGAGSTAHAWAQFRSLRAYFRPNMAFSITFSAPTSSEGLFQGRQRLYRKRTRWWNQNAGPSVCAAVATHRREDLNNVIRQLLKQNYPNLRSIICLDGAEYGPRDVAKICAVIPNSTVFYSQGKNLPAYMNEMIDRCTNDFFLKMDADDLYGENFVSDMIMETRLHDAAIYGKSEYGVYFVDTGEVVLHRAAPAEQVVPRVAGGTICATRDVIETVRFDENYSVASDAKFLSDVVDTGGVVRSGDVFNYVHVRRGNVASHTWAGSERDYKEWPVYRDYRSGKLWEFFY